jgi:hypothetical protein
MVSYRHIDVLHRTHFTRLSEASFTGVFKQVVFWACNLYNGPFFWSPTFTVPIGAGAPLNPSDGFAVILIGDRLVLEPSTYIEDTQTEVSHRHTTGEKGSLG